jgi:hypothetical protein
MTVEKPKIPSQIFSWFEKLKSNYEQNVELILNNFEQSSEKQQARLDQSNQAHIDSLNQAHLERSSLQNKQIEQLQSDVEYYRQQISKQQTTIEQLNGRYDAIVSCMLADKRNDIDIKEIFANDDFVYVQPNDFISESVSNEENESVATSVENIENDPVMTKSFVTESVVTDSSENPIEVNLVNNENYDEALTEACNEIHAEADTESNFKDDDLLFDQAILQRQTGDSEQAFLLFEQAAKQGHIKAMGAMGRSFFLGEGTQENHPLGLAWLINAANNNLPQALDRVKHFRDNDPELYQEALELSSQLA